MGRHANEVDFLQEQAHKAQLRVEELRGEEQKFAPGTPARKTVQRKRRKEQRTLDECLTKLEKLRVVYKSNA